ncbi:B12-binding domain-containing radical SAM protein [Thermoproteota archaeon]
MRRERCEIIESAYAGNILLVYPQIPQDTYWSFSRILHYIGKKSSSAPLGLTTIASLIPERYRLKLVDMNVDPLTDEDIDEADVVFTSSMLVQKESLADVIKRVQARDRKVVVGGPYPTQFFDEIPEADHFVLGEAESGVLDAFFNDYENGGAKKAYARHMIRPQKKGNSIDVKAYEELQQFFGDKEDIQLVRKRPPMSESPLPRFDLLDINAYAAMAVQLSRGCPYQCHFCNEPALFGHVPRLKTGEQMVAELEKLVSLGYTGSVFVVDDNLVGNKRDVKKVLRPIIDFQEKNDYPLDFYTEADITLAIDPDLMELMRDAGFNMAFVGIESPDEDVLKFLGKSHNLRMDTLEAVRRIQAYGIEVSAGLIVGNDDDPPDIHEKTFDFCQKAGIPTAMVSPLNVMKGSVLYENMKAEGRLVSNFTGNNTHNVSVNFIPRKSRPEDIIRDYNTLLDNLYDESGENYFERCNVLFDNLGTHPKPSRSIGLSELKALGMSALLQTFFRPHSKEYRRFVAHTLKHHRQKFPEAITKAIIYQHFRSITEDALKP